MPTDSVKVEFVVGRATRENAKRENHAERVARARQLFATGEPVTYRGRLSTDGVSAWVAGKTLATPAGPFDLSKHTDAGRCILCRGVHGVKGNPDHVALISWYSKGKEIFALSDTCRQDYFQSAGYVDKLANPDQYRADYPKTTK